VIASFRCKETEKIFRRKFSRQFASIQRVALRKLIALDAARQLSDLAGVGMSLEALKADRDGQHSIRVNDKYRICFTWADGSAAYVEIVDYH
jgi:toxin HigB-1